jgi:hypothetical protein
MVKSSDKLYEWINAYLVKHEDTIEALKDIHVAFLTIDRQELWIACSGFVYTTDEELIRDAIEKQDMDPIHSAGLEMLTAIGFNAHRPILDKAVKTYHDNTDNKAFVDDTWRTLRLIVGLARYVRSQNNATPATTTTTTEKPSFLERWGLWGSTTKK